MEFYEAFELLSEESKLCRGNYSVPAGNPPMFTNPGVGPTGKCIAVKWDIMGAIAHCYEGNVEAYSNAIKTIQYSSFIRSWVKNYLDECAESELTKLKKSYAADWPLFNDIAPFEVIHEFLKTEKL